MSSDDAVFSDVIVFAGAPCLLTSLGLPPQPEEMEKQWLREDSLIAKGQVEVLLLDKDVSASQSAGNHVCSVLSHISTMMNKICCAELNVHISTLLHHCLICRHLSIC